MGAQESYPEQNDLLLPEDHFKPMFQYFPKISYGFSGGTFEVTDIFKSITVKFDNPDALLKTTTIIGERPDQLSNRLYRNSQYYWSLFLVNGIKNPFREWAQSQESYVSQIESEYDGWVYQFANTSQFLPPVGSTGFGGSVLKHYEGTDLTGILPGDLLIYETGSGPFSIKCYGAGGVTSTSDCGSPQYGQAIVPDTFVQQPNIKQIVAGNNFTACLDSRGYIYAWGDINLTTLFNKSGTLYTSKVGGYTFIDASSRRIIAVNQNKTMECLSSDSAECVDFYLYSADTTPNVVKTAWTNNKVGGVAIKNDGTAVGYGFTAPASLYSVDCGYGYCVGVLPSTYGLTAFGTNAGNGNLNVPAVTGITMVSVGYTHALALSAAGTIYAWGNSTDDQLNVPSGTFSKIAAGRAHSSALDTNGNLQIWGNVIRYGVNGSSCPGVTFQKVTPLGMTGSFSNISSGYHHLVLQGSGTNKKYVGVVDTVDTLYKRIFVKTYQFPDTTSVLLNDPSGTIVSVWRYNESSQKYQQVKTIQHKLLSIDKYLDYTKYISLAGEIVDPSINNNWETVYLTGYQNTSNNESFVTPRKELLDIDLYNKTQIKQISLAGIKNLETAIKSVFSTNNTNEIKISDL